MKSTLLAIAVALISTVPAHSESLYAFDELDYSTIAGISMHLGVDSETIYKNYNETFSNRRVYEGIMEEFRSEAEKFSQGEEIQYITPSWGIPLKLGKYDFDKNEQYICVPSIKEFRPNRELSQGGTYQSTFGNIGPTTHLYIFWGDSNRPGDGRLTRCDGAPKVGNKNAEGYRYSGLRLNMRDSATAEVFYNLSQQTPLAMEFICGPVAAISEKGTLGCRVMSVRIQHEDTRELVTDFSFQDGAWKSVLF